MEFELMLLVGLYYIFAVVGAYLYLEIWWMLDTKKFIIKMKRIHKRQNDIRLLFEYIEKRSMIRKDKIDQIAKYNDACQFSSAIVKLEEFDIEFDKFPDQVYRVCKLVNVDILDKIEYESADWLV